MNGPPLSFSTTHPSPTLQSLHRLPVVLHFYGNTTLWSFQFYLIFTSPFPLPISHSLTLSLSLSLLRFILKNRKFHLFTAAKLLLTLGTIASAYLKDFVYFTKKNLLGSLELNFIWSSLTTRSDLNNVVWFLMGDLLRLSSWSGVFEIRVLWWCGCRVLYVREKIVAAI